MATIAVEHKASHTLVRVRSFLGDPFADEMTAPIADGVDVPVIADLDAAFLVVDTKTGLQFETHRSPLDLLTDTSLDPKRRYGAYTTLYSTQSQEAATKAVFELCPGKSGQAVFKSTKDLYGLAQPGSQTMAGAIERFSQVLGWSDDQRTVLSAVSANEGKLDSVNTWDRAFLSFGILQWALFTSDAEGGGELAALLEFIDRNDPARYEEYFGQFGLQYVDVGPHRDDLVPRGWTKLDSTVLDGRALKDAMRGYDWTTYFRAAGFDPAVQLLELRFAYERFKQLRELTITLTDGVEYSIGDLFTSQHSVALLYDQYTNLPPKLAPNIKSAIGNRLPSGGRFEGDTLTAIIDAYASSRDVIKDANNNDYRRDQINTWNLSTSAGTFVWPT
jgi:hypothetical protein